MCKLVCPECENTLKEEGTVQSDVQYNYRIYKNTENDISDAGKYILIECLVCNYTAKPFGFEQE